MSQDELEERVSTKQGRIAEIAKKYSDKPMLSIAHNIDLEWLYIAYKRTRKDGALGVDGVSAEEYAKDLKGNLTSLLNRFKSGEYRAPAVRRIHIPKGKGNETRPLGIPTFEDKILQRAVLMALNPIFEQDFFPFSYGFREGRSAHQALEQLRNDCTKLGGGWVIDLDIRKYFDSIDHSHFRDIFKQRVCDGVITRIIGKWLKAGVLDEGQLWYNEAGTPQGAVISPVMSNIFLHEVLDKWFIKDVSPRLKGKASMVRFADDAVLVCERREDALKVMDVLPKRFAKYKLALHPEKTRLVQFVKPNRDDDEKPGSFTFLGFTLYWGVSRKGRALIKWKTEKSRLARSIKAIHLWMKKNRHMKLGDQHKTLTKKIRGHYVYYGMTFNSRSLHCFHYQCVRSWHKWLCRRSRKNRLEWVRFSDLLKHYPLPLPKIYHSLWGKALS